MTDSNSLLHYRQKRDKSTSILKKFGFTEEYMEIARSNSGDRVFDFTGFPKPEKNYKLIYETPHLSIEEIYFWVLEEIKVSQAFPHVHKITDIFTASEQSSFFGTAQQRLGLQQDKVSMFLATIGKMVKELFQLVRELRILKERLGYYKDSMNQSSRGRISAEITLKGIWVDMVEQGAKNPASVYGMARELQFVTLPDLFFSIHPRTPDEVDDAVDRTEFNRKVKEVLKRKLRQFAEWKISTQSEMQVRHDFTLKYLRQHFDVIKMYMAWVKPYLRNIKRMEMRDRTQNADLINAFEGSLVELEFMAMMRPTIMLRGEEFRQNEVYYSVANVHFYYRTKPQMNYMQEYQRGPLHVGQIEMTFRAYAWTQAEIENYIKMKEAEDLDLLSSIDGSVKAAMVALGDELENYLKEAGEDVDFSKELDDKTAMNGIKKAVDPFTSVFGGLKEIFGAFRGKKSASNHNPIQLQKEKSRAAGGATACIWLTYKNFKKREGIIAW
jgi:hypothetical protein